MSSAVITRYYYDTNMTELRTHDSATYINIVGGSRQYIWPPAIDGYEPTIIPTSTLGAAETINFMYKKTVLPRTPIDPYYTKRALATGENLLTNGDFESNILDTYPNNNHWTTVNQASVSVTDEQAYAGKQSLKITYTGFSGTLAQDSGLKADFHSIAKPNTAYSATGWLYSSVARGINVRGLSNSYTGLGNSRTFTVKANTWTPFEINWTTETDVSNASFLIMHNDTNTTPIYVDCIKVEEGTQATGWMAHKKDEDYGGFMAPANILLNSDLQDLPQGATDTVLDGSFNGGQHRGLGCVTPAYCYSHIATATPVRNNRVLWVKSGTTGRRGLWFSHTGAVEEPLVNGKQYTFSFIAQGTGSIQYGYEGGTIPTTAIASGNTIDSGNWQIFTSTFTYDSSKTAANLICYSDSVATTQFYATGFSLVAGANVPYNYVPSRADTTYYYLYSHSGEDRYGERVPVPSVAANAFPIQQTRGYSQNLWSDNLSRAGYPNVSGGITNPRTDSIDWLSGTQDRLNWKVPINRGTHTGNLMYPANVNMWIDRYGITVNQSTITLKASTQYTFSAIGRISEEAKAAGSVLAVYLWNGDWSLSKSVTIDTLTNSHKSVTFTTPAKATSFVCSVSIYCYPSGKGEHPVYCEWVTLYEGAKDLGPYHNAITLGVMDFNTRNTKTNPVSGDWIAITNNCLLFHDSTGKAITTDYYYSGKPLPWSGIQLLENAPMSGIPNGKDVGTNSTNDRANNPFRVSNITSHSNVSVKYEDITDNPLFDKAIIQVAPPETTATQNLGIAQDTFPVGPVTGNSKSYYLHLGCWYRTSDNTIDIALQIGNAGTDTDTTIGFKLKHVPTIADGKWHRADYNLYNAKTLNTNAYFYAFGAGTVEWAGMSCTYGYSPEPWFNHNTARISDASYTNAGLPMFATVKIPDNAAYISASTFTGVPGTTHDYRYQIYLGNHHQLFRKSVSDITTRPNILPNGGFDLSGQVANRNFLSYGTGQPTDKNSFYAGIGGNYDYGPMTKPNLLYMAFMDNYLNQGQQGSNLNNWTKNSYMANALKTAITYDAATNKNSFTFSGVAQVENFTNTFSLPVANQPYMLYFSLYNDKNYPMTATVSDGTTTTSATILDEANNAHGYYIFFTPKQTSITMTLGFGNFADGNAAVTTITNLKVKTNAAVTTGTVSDCYVDLPTTVQLYKGKDYALQYSYVATGFVSAMSVGFRYQNDTANHSLASGTNYFIRNNVAVTPGTAHWYTTKVHFRPTLDMNARWLAFNFTRPNYGDSKLFFDNLKLEEGMVGTDFSYNQNEMLYQVY